jgi:hypothetical protein
MRNSETVIGRLKGDIIRAHRRLRHGQGVVLQHHADRGKLGLHAVTQSCDVCVDKNKILYVTDTNAGLSILQFDGV